MRQIILALLKRIERASALQSLGGDNIGLVGCLTSKTEMQLLRILVNQQAHQDREDSNMDTKYEMYCDFDGSKDGAPRINPDSLLAATEKSSQKFLALYSSDTETEEEEEEESEEDDEASALLRDTKLVPLPTLEDMRAKNPGLVAQINPTLRTGSSSVCGGALAMVTLTQKPTPIDREIVLGKTSIQLPPATTAIATPPSNTNAEMQSKSSRKRKRPVSRKRQR